MGGKLSVEDFSMIAKASSMKRHRALSTTEASSGANRLEPETVVAETVSRQKSSTKDNNHQ